MLDLAHLKGEVSSFRIKIYGETTVGPTEQPCLALEAVPLDAELLAISPEAYNLKKEGAAFQGETAT